MYVDHQTCVEMRKAIEKALEIKRPGYVLVSIHSDLSSDVIQDSQRVLVQFIKCPSRIRSKFTQLIYKYRQSVHGFPILWVPPIRDKGSDLAECVCRTDVMFYIRNTYLNG